ncbi:hypothetical protein PFISCL1PPCAC_19783, partial [Pristionchus fissidentatus]
IIQVMRRSRVQFKPNIGAAATTSALDDSKVVKVVEALPTAPSEVVAVGDVHTPEAVTSTSNAPTEVQDTVPIVAHHTLVPSIHVETVNPENDNHVFRSPYPKNQEAGRVISPRSRLLSSSSACDGGILISPRNRLLSTSSEIFSVHKKDRRKFTGDEDLDPKTMRMSDLITWNPKKEKKLDRSKLDNCETRSEVEREEERPAAPQLKLDADGKLVVDETSLLLDERATQSAWQVVEEDRMTRKVNSASFRRWRKGTPWSEKETEFFYEVLRSTGSDFGLMHDFFPRRARNELKSKYNREEKYNWDRLKSVLAKPIVLKESLYERAETMADELDREESEKIEAKMKKKEKKKKDGETAAPIEEEEEWDETTADLYAEAVEMMNECIEEDRRKEELLRVKKEEKKKKMEERKKLSKKASDIIGETVSILKKRKKNEDGEKDGKKRGKKDENDKGMKSGETLEKEKEEGEGDGKKGEKKSENEKKEEKTVVGKGKETVTSSALQGYPESDGGE